MNVDNFDKAKEFILNTNPKFDTDDDAYYQVELLRRGKDNPNLPAANYCFKVYYFNCISDFDRFKEEIITLCEIFKLRAYFGVNRKSYKQVLLDTTAECARRSAAHDYKKPYKIWQSCSSKYHASDKYWVLDFDDVEKDKAEDIIRQYSVVINEMCSPNDLNKVITSFNTRTGLHLITKPFNVMDFLNYTSNFEYKITKDDIKKNHITLLYCNL